MLDLIWQVKIRRKISPLDKDKSKKKYTKGEKQEKSFAQKKGHGNNIICNVRGKPGELASNCPLKQEIAMKNWFVKIGKELYK